MISDSTKKRVSLIIPLFNEEEVLPELFTKLDELLSSVDACILEVCLIDDGSTDKTLEIIKNKVSESSSYHFISFSRNFGHQAAIGAGFKMVNADACIVMDGDLQDNPQDIVKLIEKWREGYEVVYVVREKRKEGFIFRFCYYLFYRLLNLLSNTEIPADSGDFALLDKKVMRQIAAFDEQNPFWRGIRSWIGFKQTGIKLERMQRAGGEPKYSFRKLFKLAYDGFFSFSFLPLKLVTWLGIIYCLLSFAGLALIIYLKFAGAVEVPGWSSLAVLLLFIGGTQLFSIGIVAEYIARIFDEVKQRPLYICKETDLEQNNDR